MFAKHKVMLAAVALLSATAWVTTPGIAAADGHEGLIARGVYDGIWHTDKVKVIIEKVSRDGTISGIVHFDKTSRWPDAKFNFTGQIGGRDALTIQRDPDDCNQVAHAGPPEREGRYWVWRGEVSGDGLDRPYAFELRIPR
jgi:hypothetical protein